MTPVIAEHETATSAAAGASSETSSQASKWRDFAGLGVGEIARMTRDEMLHLIRSSGLSDFKRNVPERLQLLDTDTLRKLSFLAHRCCCNRQN